MTIFCYKSGKSIMMAAYYKGDKSMMTSLIIIKIRFICFQEDEIGGSQVKSHAKSHAELYARLHARSNTRLHDYRFYNYRVIFSSLVLTRLGGFFINSLFNS